MRYSRASYAAFIGVLLFAPLSVHAATIAVTVDFASPTGATATPFAYGLNAFQAFDQKIAGSPGSADYKANVDAMDAGILRIANAGEMDDSSADPYYGWLKNADVHMCDLSNVQWDTAKIAKAVQGSYSYGPVRMVDIENWPACAANASGRLRTSQYAAYVALCADLVKILNVDDKLGVKYFEVFNELDTSGYDGQMATVAKIYNQAAVAMKAVDPTIMVGGPAFTVEDASSPNMDDFFKVAAAHLDFVTYHSYADCDDAKGETTPTFEVYNAASYAGATAYQTVKTEFAKYSAKPTPFFLDEFNINGCVYGNNQVFPDPRMYHAPGAVFDALTMINAIDAGVAGTMAWNEADQNYGKLNANRAFTRRPSSYLYQLLNALMRGPVYETNPGPQAHTVVPLAVKSGEAFVIELVNRSSSANSVALTVSGLSNLNSATQFTVNQISSAGWTTPANATYGALSAGYTLPSDSVTFLSVPLSTQ